MMKLHFAEAKLGKRQSKNRDLYVRNRLLNGIDKRAKRSTGRNDIIDYKNMFALKCCDIDGCPLQ